MSSIPMLEAAADPDNPNCALVNTMLVDKVYGYLFIAHHHMHALLTQLEIPHKQLREFSAQYKAECEAREELSKIKIGRATE